ncbi:aldehyde dehydrogenase [Pseudonocardia sp. RS010]|uniref:aldehyde dehydrogenase n=1 Tax=Pseudonocardia sp. RS010 TaxID=3385979 RepID=UPI0039A06DE3
MSIAETAPAALSHPDAFFIGGQWVRPSSDATFEVDDSATEEIFLRVPEAQSSDMSAAVTAARAAFDEGPWPRMSHRKRAEYMRELANGIRRRSEDFAQFWTRESGILYTMSKFDGETQAKLFEYYADLADTFPFEEPVATSFGDGFGMIVREPVGVVGAIVPWNGAFGTIALKIAPALIAGCTAVVKSSPEAPGEAYVLAEVADEIGLPPGVLNFLTADREVSEQLVRDPRVDKIAFTGSNAAGQRIGSICGERLARFSLELGGKSAAVILDDYDLETAARALSGAECWIAGQVCSSVTRIIVSKPRHDQFVEALTSVFSQVVVGDPFAEGTEMGPLASSRQRDRVEYFVAKGISEGATLTTGGGRPKHLDRGWYFEPTVFANVDNSSTIGREEIFGPVLSVIPAANEADAVRIANDTRFGLNASVFTNDVDRARDVSSRLLSGTVGHNGVRTDVATCFGGFKQSGIGREGGTEGLHSYVEAKMLILDAPPSRYR